MYACQTKGPCLVDAIITCTQDSTSIRLIVAICLAELAVTEGDEIAISALDGAILPKDITFTIGPSGGDICQTVTINTSGNIDLQLKDRFGSL
jgi:hypothetical protein